MAEVTWQCAFDDFINGIMGSKEEKTARFYAIQLRQLLTWAIEQEIGLQEFTAAHMRRYLAHRADPTHEDLTPCPDCRARKGRKHAADCKAARRVCENTRRQDAIAARVFIRFCKVEGYVPADVLREFKLPKGEKPHVRTPTSEDLQKLLRAVINKHDVRVNPAARFQGARERAFWRARDYAVIATLIETGMRIGEVMALKRSDYQPERKRLSVTMAKGDPRNVPITDALIRPIEAWLKVRPACGSEYLFVTMFGEAVDSHTWSKTFRRYVEFAGVEKFTRHGIRHFTLRALVQQNVGTAQIIAGHKDAKTTLGYCEWSEDQKRADHSAVNPLGSVLGQQPEGAPKKRRKIL